jgi:acetyl esterase/lipase
VKAIHSNNAKSLLRFKTYLHKTKDIRDIDLNTTILSKIHESHSQHHDNFYILFHKTDDLYMRGLKLYTYYNLHSPAKMNTLNTIGKISRRFPNLTFCPVPDDMKMDFPEEFLHDFGTPFPVSTRIIFKTILIAFLSFRKDDRTDFHFIFRMLRNSTFWTQSMKRIPKKFKSLELDECLLFWNLPETSMVKYLIPLSFPRIQTSRMVMIPFGDRSIPIRIISNNETENSKVILQFHGGGFVAMTSFTHENYLRTWATEANATIVCVDYSLAPLSPITVAQDECFEIYKQLLAGKILHTPISKILLAGDSAGGNHMFSVVNRIIVEKLQKPDSIIGIYPATNLREDVSHSRMLSLIDPLLQSNVLEVLRLGFIIKGRDMGHYSFSPLFTPEEILKEYPPVLIVCGSLDPLLDDSLIFAKRLDRVGVTSELHVYDGLSHGFMHFVGFTFCHFFRFNWRDWQAM